MMKWGWKNSHYFVCCRWVDVDERWAVSMNLNMAGSIRTGILSLFDWMDTIVVIYTQSVTSSWILLIYNGKWCVRELRVYIARAGYIGLDIGECRNRSKWKWAKENQKTPQRQILRAQLLQMGINIDTRSDLFIHKCRDAWNVQYTHRRCYAIIEYSIDYEYVHKSHFIPHYRLTSS